MKAVANNLAFSVLKQFLILCNARNFYLAIRHLYSMCILKVNWSSIVIPSNTTSDVLSILIPLINKNNWFATHFPKIICWKLPEFGLNELTVNHINTFFKSNWRLAKILLSNLLQEYIVLSLAKLQISHFKTKKNKSLMKILNKSRPRIDSSGIPQIIVYH